MSVQFTLTDRPDLDDPNFHNAGARDLLTLMGYAGGPEDMYGVAEAEQFIGRALIASALVETSTVDAEGIPGFWEAQGRVFQGARSPGYLAERLSLLVELGLRAQQLGTKVTWG